MKITEDVKLNMQNRIEKYDWLFIFFIFSIFSTSSWAKVNDEIKALKVEDVKIINEKIDFIKDNFGIDIELNLIKEEKSEEQLNNKENTAYIFIIKSKSKFKKYEVDLMLSKGLIDPTYNQEIDRFLNQDLVELLKNEKQLKEVIYETIGLLTDLFLLTEENKKEQ